jgi:glutamine synthetase
LRAADDAALFRLYAKAFCRKRDLTASFMAQLGADFPGLSGHVHLSLQRADGSSAFHDPSDPDGMSREMRGFIAGIVAHVPDHLALSAHTVNAYRRMSPGNWAPRAANWGLRNYRVAVRAIPGRPDTCRIEYRIPAADTNPYLAIGFALAAGLDGIERGLAALPPVADDAVAPDMAALAAMPSSLGEAARRLDASVSATQFYGEPFVRRFAESRRQEEAAFRKDVSPMERQRYLES